MTRLAVTEGFAMDASPEYRNCPERALAALMHLMSRFPARRSPAIASAVVTHLRLIVDDARLPEDVRECADRLVGEWEGYALLCANDSALHEVRSLS